VWYAFKKLTPKKNRADARKERKKERKKKRNNTPPKAQKHPKKAQKHQILFSRLRADKKLSSSKNIFLLVRPDDQQRREFPPCTSRCASAQSTSKKCVAQDFRAAGRLSATDALM